MAFQSRVGRAVLELSIDGGAFVRGAADAKATMRDLARGIAQVQRDIGKQAFQFSGREQIADANKLAEAITRVGGAAKLTAAEKVKVNAQLKEAIEKYRVLGQQAPAAMLATERATRQTASASQFLTTKMVALGSFLGTLTANVAQRAVGALMDMGREAFTSAARILDLANKTGLGARTIQQMQFVADQTSSSLESFTNSSYQLGIRIQANTKEVNQALTELKKYGVEVDRLKAARPDEQWAMVTAALGRVADAQERNRLGTMLMGRTFGEVSASIGEGYGKIASQAKVATDAQLRELNRLNNEWDKFKRNLTTGFGAAMGRIALETRIRSEVVDEYFRRRKEEPGFKGFPADDSQEIRSATDYKPRFLNVEEEAQRRIQLQLYDAKTKDIQLTQEQAQAQDFYRKQLQAVNEELRKLTAGDRAEIDAALKLGADNLEDIERKFHLTARALRVYQSAIKDAARETNELNELLKSFGIGPEAKEKVLDITKGLKGKDFGSLRPEEQRAIGEALLKNVRAFDFAKEKVPADVAAVIAGILQMRMIPDFLNETAAKVNDGLGALAGVGVEGLDPKGLLGEDTAQNAITRIEARKNAAKMIRDLELSQTEFEIAQAKRQGSNWEDVYRAEAQLSRRRLDARIADSNAEFDARIYEMKKSVTVETETLDELRREQKATIDQMVEDWRQGEIAKRDEVRQTHSIWAQIRQQIRAEQSDFTKRIASEIVGIKHELTGRLFSTLFAGGDGEAKKRAKAAREDYQRLAKSGKASAEEITRAFRAMREAEEAAHSRWADRFKSIWDGIKEHLFNIFDSLLERFIDSLLQGMLNALAGALGQRIVGWFTKLIGLAGAATNAGTGGGGGAGAGAGAGVNVGFGGGGVNVGFGGPSFGGSVPGFPNRPSLFQPGPVPKMNNGGFVPPGRVTPAILHGGAHGELVVPVSKLLDRAFTAPARRFALPELRMPDIRPRASLPAPGAIASSPSGAGQPAAPRITNLNVTIQGWDGADIERVMRDKMVPDLKKMLRLNTDDLGYEIRRTVEIDRVEAKATTALAGLRRKQDAPWALP